MKALPYIVANFKNYGTLSFFKEYLAALAPLTAGPTVVLCPPTPYLSSVQQLLLPGYHLGAQDCSISDETVTGETQASMLTQLGVTFSLIGHSERVKHLQETDDLIAQKVTRACSQKNITPIVCLGEPEDVYVSKRQQVFLKERLLRIVPSSTPKLILAYEPLWAIGTNRVPRLEEIEDVCAFLGDQAHIHLGYRPTILYGGSVSASNVSDILGLSVGGVLVGRACLETSFLNTLLKT